MTRNDLVHWEAAMAFIRINGDQHGVDVDGGTPLAMRGPISPSRHASRYERITRRR
jgi:hypothetical protein